MSNKVIDKNGLKMLKIQTATEVFSNFDTNVIGSYFKDTADIVVYMDYAVLEGVWSSNKIDLENFDWKYVQKMRIFTEEKELYVWRVSADSFRARLRTDGVGAECDVVEASQQLRPRENHAPRSIKTINYIGYNESGQAGYVDSRFVKFEEV